MINEDDETTLDEHPGPGCANPDCGAMQCLWSGMPFCFPCARVKVGEDELIHRWYLTHDGSWDDAAAD